MPNVYGSIDLQGNELRAAVVQNLAAAPTVPAPKGGQLWYDSANNLLMWYDGTTWISASGGVVPGPGAAATPETAFGLPVVNGSATTYSPSDHSHGSPPHTAAEHTTFGFLTGVTGSNGVAVDSVTDPAIPAVSAVVAPGSDPALSVGATGLSLDGTAFAVPGDVTAEIEAAVDGLTILSTSASLVATQSGGTATSDLTWTLDLASIDLANTYTGSGTDTATIEADLTGRTPAIVSEIGDLYINDATGLAFLCNFGAVPGPAAWTALASAAAGVTAITAGNGIGVNATNPNVPVVSAVVAPLSDPALSVGATGLSLDGTAVSHPADITAAITAAAGAGLVEAAGVIDIVASTTNPGIVVTANDIGIDPTVLGTKKFAAALPATGVPLVHSLGTTDVVVAVYAGTAQVMADVVITDLNSVTITYNPPIVGGRVVVIG